MHIKDDDLPSEGAGREELEELYKMSLDDAKKSQSEWEKQQGVKEQSPEGKTSQLRIGSVGPFFRWHDAQRLITLHESLKGGDRMAVLAAISLCAVRGFAIPRWCSKAYLQGYNNVINYKARSWDEAFGEPYPKGTHLDARHNKRKYMPIVYHLISVIKDRDPSVAIDGYLFETVGRELGIGGKTLTEKYYYEAKKLYEIKDSNTDS